MYSQVLDNFWNSPTYKRPYYYIHNKNTSNIVPTNPITGELTDTTWESNTKVTYDYSDGRKVSIRYDKDPRTNIDAKVQNIGISMGSGIGKSGTDSANNIYGPKENINFGKDGNGNTIISGSSLLKTISVNGEEVSFVERGANIRYGNSSPVRMEIRYGTDDSVFKLVKVYIDYIKAPQYIRLTQQELDQTEDTSQVLEYPDDVCQEIINELVHIVMENISDQRIQTHPVVSQSIANPVQQQTETVAQPQQ